MLLCLTPLAILASAAVNGKGTQHMPFKDRRQKEWSGQRTAPLEDVCRRGEGKKWQGRQGGDLTCHKFAGLEAEMPSAEAVQGGGGQHLQQRHQGGFPHHPSRPAQPQRALPQAAPPKAGAIPVSQCLKGSVSILEEQSVGKSSKGFADLYIRRLSMWTIS